MKTATRSRRGNINLVQGLIVTMVFLAVMIPVGLYLWQGVTTSIDQTGWTAAANNTMTTLTTNIGTGFGLLAIVPIVIIAGGIIAILYAYFRGGGG